MSALEARFWKYVNPEPNTGCFLWGGSLNNQGYGQLRMSKTVLKSATHVAMELAGSPVPMGLFVLHRCDVPACVNPDHLFIGSQKDNIADCIAKGRHSKPPISKPGRWRPAVCRRGHPLSGDNVYFPADQRPRCVACRSIAKGSCLARLAAAGLTTRGTPKAVVS
jgi:hypothetical protein